MQQEPTRDLSEYSLVFMKEPDQKFVMMVTALGAVGPHSPMDDILKYAIRRVIVHHIDKGEQEKAVALIGSLGTDKEQIEEIGKTFILHTTKTPEDTLPALEAFWSLLGLGPVDYNACVVPGIVSRLAIGDDFIDTQRAYKLIERASDPLETLKRVRTGVVERLDHYNIGRWRDMVKFVFPTPATTPESDVMLLLSVFYYFKCRSLHLRGEDCIADDMHWLAEHFKELPEFLDADDST